MFFAIIYLIMIFVLNILIKILRRLILVEENNTKNTKSIKSRFLLSNKLDLNSLIWDQISYKKL